MKTYTTLDTISEAWIILEEIGLDKLLLGHDAQFDAKALLNALLKERKLHEFLAVITHDDATKMGGLSITDAVETISDFFNGIAGGLKGLSGLGIGLNPTPVTQKNPTQG